MTSFHPNILRPQSPIADSRERGHSPFIQMLPEKLIT